MLAHRSEAANQARTTRAAVTNNPLRRASGNTAAGRRVRDLYRAYLEAMGNPADAVAQADALAAAELKVAAEEARGRLLSGETADVDQVVRIENLAHRASRKLGIRPGGAPAATTLAEHLARRAAERASEPQGDPA